ncbi:MAG: 2-succinyl-5-enolpyruvyl-6-hydroxy-3-cyclohexene-1-carboxylic-acid synthase [Chloroflexota bacterium]
MNKEHIGRLAAIMVAKGIEQVVVSPGSRNAPVIILFGKNRSLKLLSVGDERSAGFFALGLALQSQKTVALLCTSGSAVLNYAPAIAEAYYQKIPLLVLTADRPVELIDQGDSQTIRQQNVFSNYIRKSFNLPVAIHSNNERWYTDRVVNEAIDRTMYPVQGPVQLNIPLDEPLYDIDYVIEGRPAIIRYNLPNQQLNEESMQRLAGVWKSASSVMIVAGQMSPSQEVKDLLLKLAEDPSIVVLTETTSNLTHNRFINCIDRTIAVIPASKNKDYAPDLLITIGGAIISKKIKAMLRDMSPANHWHISNDPDEFHFDTYKSLTETIPLNARDFLTQLQHELSTKHLLDSSEDDQIQRQDLINTNNSNSYYSKWQLAVAKTAQKHSEYMERIEFTDFRAYHTIFEHLPENTAVHLGNSTPVRYAQLFDQRINLKFYANRGTSGIDGCTSTAAGFAYNYSGLTVIITGDIGFLYDSNGLWNSNLPERFKIILINNGGGNIFRIIDGPTGHEELEPFIETRHNLQAAGIASNFNIEYFKASDEDELKSQLPLFLKPQDSHRPALLEIITNNQLSAQTLRDYFGFLRK